MTRPILPAALLMLASPAADAQTPPSPRGQPIQIACVGPVVVAGRKVAAADKLSLGMNPKACFGRMKIYDGASHEFVVTAPSAACPKGTALDVYGRSRAGSWYSFFEKPICGSTISIGPKNQWGDWMLTVDGRRYHSRGAWYVPAP